MSKLLKNKSYQDISGLKVSQDKLLNNYEEKKGMPFILSQWARLLDFFRARDIKFFVCGVSCCADSIESLDGIKYNLKRLNMSFASSIFDADVLVVSGLLNEDLKKIYEEYYQKMQSRKYVVAIGACALNFGMYKNSKVKKYKVEDIFDVDVFVPGCPPSEEALLFAFGQLKKKVQKRNRIWVYNHG